MYNGKKIEPKLLDLPDKPGVYIMHDAYGEVIYVGKAINLKRRVTQYFRLSEKPVKVQAMVDNIDDLEYVITLSEADALTLEATLVKKHMPRYNILLKDDKYGGVYIRIDLAEQFPTFETTRRPKKDKCKYFGAYGNGVSAKAIVSILKLVYGVRTCPKKMSVKRECLDYHIGLCLAPCTNRVTHAEYKIAVNNAIAFLSGKSGEPHEILKAKMQAAADADEFERAIRYRTALESLKSLGERSISNLGAIEDADVVAYVTNGLMSAVSVMPIKKRKLFAAQSYPSADASESEDALSSFLMQYYAENPVPSEVFVNLKPSESLADCLAAFRGSKVSVTQPKRGIKHDLVATAEENARECVEKNVDRAARHAQQTTGACDMLCAGLGLKTARRIECYDISHISGTDKVASGVCFIGGEKASSEYRRYRIKTVEGNDDFHCMAEVLSRRLKRAADGDEKFAELPDLIIIDGGKGQLHAAYDVMTAAGFDVPMIGLAKKQEEVFVTDRPEPIIFSRDSAALKLLQRVRDEAHRFAITYHRNTRLKRIKTRLTEIDGVGEKRAKVLLKAFGNIDNISKLPLEALEALQGIDIPTARKVYEYFHPTTDTAKDN